MISNVDFHVEVYLKSIEDIYPFDLTNTWDTLWKLFLWWRVFISFHIGYERKFFILYEYEFFLTQYKRSKTLKEL